MIPDDVPADRNVNLAWWEERAGPHARSSGYGIERLVAEPGLTSEAVAFDLPLLGRLNGLDVVHLQCHIGTDTVSLARIGARSITGLDFSPAALAQAAVLAERCGVAARWVCSDVYNAPSALGQTYDLVYTGLGALNWLPDVAKWARVVAALLRPGGRLFIREGHPMMFTLRAQDPELTIRYPYFQTTEPIDTSDEQTDGLTYVATDEELTDLPTCEWNHGLGEVVQGLIDAGLQIAGLVEHRSIPWEPIRSVVDIGGGEYALPEGRDRLPMTYTLQARRPDLF